MAYGDPLSNLLADERLTSESDEPVSSQVWLRACLLIRENQRNGFAVKPTRMHHGCFERIIFSDIGHILPLVQSPHQSGRGQPHSRTLRAMRGSN
jgi:hypothetical protein